MWVECFPESSSNLEQFTDDEGSNPMCPNCNGPWKDKCEWFSYEPGALAFAGPAGYCGFKYPKCAASVGKNCFCGESAVEIQKGWCNNGNMENVCPKTHDYGDGRTSECNWSGWTLSPQSGNPASDCSSWGFSTNGDPAAASVRTAEKPAVVFAKSEPGPGVQGAEMSLAGAGFLGLGIALKKRKLRQKPEEKGGVQMKQTATVV
jgi:hypothetical protein